MIVELEQPPLLPQPKLRTADLYCGAGGSAKGAEDSDCADVVLAINHWQPAIATHSKNFPETRHILSTVDLVDPQHDKTLPELDLLMAGVECTHHSNARGGMPVCDQRRSGAREVYRWAKHKRPEWVIVENVREFRNWGPLRFKLDKDGNKIWDKRRQDWALEPDPDHKGEFFDKWVRSMRRIGYRVEWRLLNSADYGEAQKRIRLFIICRRGKRGTKTIPWPKPTHDEHGAGGLAKWRAAAEIIDWSKPGTSIFGRPRGPLADKTLRRVEIGLWKFNGWHKRVSPFLIHLRGTGTALDIARPTPTITGGGTHLGLVDPYLVVMKGRSNAASCGFPMPTLTAHAAHLAIAEPHITKYHAGDERKWRGAMSSIREPLPTLDTQPRFGVVTPFVFQLIGRGAGRSYDIGHPLPTVLASRNNFGVMMPYVFGVDHRSGDGGLRAAEFPLTTITSKQRHCLASPFLLQTGGPGHSGMDPRVNSIDRPMPTLTAAHIRALATPYLVPQFGERGGQLPRTHSAYSPLPAVTSHGAGAVVSPYLIAVNHGDQGGNIDRRLYSIDDPLTTITNKRQHGLLLPFVTEYYGTADARAVSDPLSTVTTKHRHGLTLFGDAQHGKKLVVLNAAEAKLWRAMLFLGIGDILFRMLMVDELKQAQGFDRDYWLDGNQEEQVKQIGNAVPVRVMRAICRAIGDEVGIGSTSEPRSGGGTEQ